MNKIYNTSIKKIGEDYYLNYYLSAKPDIKKNYFVGFDMAHKKWEKSKLSILIHPSQIKDFEKLADDIYMNQSEAQNPLDFIESLEQGIDLPSENIEIKGVCCSPPFPNYSGHHNDCDICEQYKGQYAFLKTLPPISKEEEKAPNEKYNKWNLLEELYEHSIDKMTATANHHCGAFEWLRNNYPAPLEDKLISQEELLKEAFEAGKKYWQLVQTDEPLMYKPINFDEWYSNKITKI